MRALHRTLRKLSRHPALAPLFDELALTLWRLRLGAVTLAGRVSSEPTRPIQVRPQDVRRGLWRLDLLRSLGLRRQRDMVGYVRDGDWDRDDYVLSQLGIFEAIRQHYEDHTPWEQIPYFQDIRRTVEAGRPRFKYRSLDDIPRQWRRIDRLYDQIRSHGFQSQAQLGTRRLWDEIVLAVDREGQLLFLDGRHRLAIARVLGCQRVPALVGVRHCAWAELRRQLTGLDGEDAILLPSHPDLPGTVWPPSPSPELELMIPYLPPPPGPILDLEPGFGYWCQQMEEKGYDTYAVSAVADPRLARLKTACGMKLSLLDEAAGKLPFPIALALGGGPRRLWNLPAGELERLLGDLHPVHLIVRTTEPDDDKGEFAAFLDRLGTLLGLSSRRALKDPSGPSRLILLQAETTE